MDYVRVRPPVHRRPAARAAAAAVAGVVTITAAVGLGPTRPPTDSLGETMPAPRYTSSGALLRPRGFETWVLAGASLGLGYGERFAGGEGPGMFHNVYIQRAAYDAYVRTGDFPEKTMMVMTLYGAGEKVAPSKQGYFEGDFIGMEAAVKDSERHSEGWAYYSFTRNVGTLLDSAHAFPKSACYSCHVAHAAKDNVFIQFYPLLRQSQRSGDRPAP